MPQRAILYARVSSDDRHTDDRNLQGQLDLCRQYAQAHGYEIVAELHEDDRGASGAVFELPQLNLAREMARTGACDVLVVRELDRLSRRLAKQLLVEEELQRCGVQIEYVLDHYADTPEGNLVKHVKAAIAEFERIKIVERTVRGRELKVKAGSLILHDAPFGYDLVRQGPALALVVNEAEAQVVRQIFQWYTVGDDTAQLLGTHQIHCKLHAERIPSPAAWRGARYYKKREPLAWNRQAVVRILANETYAGVWHWRKTAWRDGKHIPRPADEWLSVPVPAIISRAIWDAAVTRRAANKIDKSCWRRCDTPMMLAGRATCGLCGARIGARRCKGVIMFTTWYVCPARTAVPTQYSHTCALPRFRGESLEAAIWAWLRSLLSQPAALAGGWAALQDAAESERAPLRAQVTAIDEQLAAVQRETEQLLDQFVAGRLTQPDLVQRKGACDTQAATLRQERAALVLRLAPMPTVAGHTLADLQAFARQVNEALAAAPDATLQRTAVETLDVRIRLSVEDGQQVAYACCSLGEQRLVIRGDKAP